MADPVLLWLRQDLRLADQPALAAAAAEGPVVPVYVLDDETSAGWRQGRAQRWWLHHSLAALGRSLEERCLRLILRRGRAADEIARLAAEVGARRVHALHHYEPWWREAERQVAARLDLRLHDGLTLAPPDGIRSGSGTPFKIFTPFWRALKERMPPPLPGGAPPELRAPDHWPRGDRLENWGLTPARPDWASRFEDEWTPGEAGALARMLAFRDALAAYDEARDFPAREGSSHLSPHLHFGELSPHRLWHVMAKAAGAGAEPFLRELGWRDFAQGVVLSNPAMGEANARPHFDRFPWRTGPDADADFAAWTKGRTGYPIVDAGMRQLWKTGWMHNRVRMIAASFLVKHLLIDWRRGARWFWDTLVDADYGNNSINWQWIAGTGFESNPFGRIMAPLLQSEKFSAGDYIRRWAPELAGVPDPWIHDPHAAGRAPRGYPEPLIGHREARARALAALGANSV